eukprot:5835289-Amphidinium_carterae.1
MLCITCCCACGVVSSSACKDGPGWGALFRVRRKASPLPGRQVDKKCTKYVLGKGFGENRTVQQHRMAFNAAL